MKAKKAAVARRVRVAKNTALQTCDTTGNSPLYYPDTVFQMGLWVGLGKRPDPGSFTVTREGMREILITIKQAQYLASALRYQKLPGDHGLRQEFAKYLEEKWLAEFQERTFDVWMEGSVVASGLFIIGNDVLINGAAEREGVRRLVGKPVAPLIAPALTPKPTAARGRKGRAK